MKTAELSDAALDWAVTKCEGFDVDTDGGTWGLWGWATKWEQGGPIIERENICLWTEGYNWEAKQYGACEQWGDTPLIAAMRCYVASKLGDDIDIPKELT